MDPNTAIAIALADDLNRFDTEDPTGDWWGEVCDREPHRSMIDLERTGDDPGAGEPICLVDGSSVVYSPLLVRRAVDCGLSSTSPPTPHRPGAPRCTTQPTEGAPPMDRKTREVTITRWINPGPYRTIGEIMEANRDAGFYFFSPDTLRGFGSRIGETVYGSRYFTTSERGGFDQQSPRTYSVRMAMPDGRVETLGEFGQFDTSAQARRAAVRAAAGPVVVRHDPYSDGTGVVRDPDPERYEWRPWLIGTTGPFLSIGTRGTRARAEEIARMLNDERNAR